MSPLPEPKSAGPEQFREQGVWSHQVHWVLCALLLGSCALDVLYLGYFNAWALVLRAVWVLNTLVYAYLVHRGLGAWARPITDLNLLISCACLLGLVFMMGGVRSPHFLMVPIVPLCTALLYREHLRMSLLGGLMVCAGTLVCVLWEELPFNEAMTWFLMVLACSVVGLHLSQQTHQAQQAEQQARLERTRRESLEALALSEHRRAQSEKLAIVGRLASGVAHEINNPLAYVGSNIEYVRDELLSSGEVRREELAEVLRETRVGLQHIRQIASDLRGFSRMGDDVPTECALADVVADALKLASLRLKHVAWLRVEVPAELPEIFVVRRRLVQVVLNLLINAGDVLEAHQVKDGEVRVVGRTEAGRVVLFIEDNGPGFAPHVLPRLFEAFFTTKELDKGTGLGLTLSRELVEQFGGSLTADNRPEGGARLRIEFPIRQVVAPPDKLPASQRRMQGVA